MADALAQQPLDFALPPLQSLGQDRTLQKAGAATDIASRFEHFDRFSHANRSLCSLFDLQMKSYMSRIFPTGVVTFLLAVAAPAAADAPFAGPQVIQNWTIEQLEDGCIMSRRYSRSTEFSLGWMKRDASERLLARFAKDGWSAKAGERYELNFVIGSEVFSATGQGVSAPPGQGAIATFMPIETAKTIASADSLTIFLGETPLEKLALDGSSAAIAAIKSCSSAVWAQKKADEIRDKQVPADPFSH